jgi:hypothetical protein
LRGLAVWIFSKQAMLLFLFGLFFILYNFLMVLNNAVCVLEANTILYKISDAYSQVSLINVKKISMTLPETLEESISTKTEKYETPYKIYVFNRDGRTYFICEIKKGKEVYNISGISFNSQAILFDCRGKKIFDQKNCKEKDQIVFDPKKSQFLSIEKTDQGVIVYV